MNSNVTRQPLISVIVPVYNIIPYLPRCVESLRTQTYENLEILLKFVFTPYFTDENVAKERGIIAQEIRMVEDTPGWQVFVGLFEGLYRNHPVRVSIPGSEESISRITRPALGAHEPFSTSATLRLQ